MRRLRRRGIALTLTVTLGLGTMGVACIPFTPLTGVDACNVTTADTFWRGKADTLPVLASSPSIVSTIGATKSLHADFGSGLYEGEPMGIPYNVVPGTQPKVAVDFDYADESDPGPYPIPPNPLIEGGPSSTGDRHILIVDKDNCILYELYDAHPNGDGTWHAGSGAIFDMKSNAMRPDGWTSADAAGLAILPGLVRYDEVASGSVNHVIRMTIPATAASYLWPASHQAQRGTGGPPMGTRIRLKANADLSQVDPSVLPIAKALQSYGAIVADNGSAWYISGEPDDRWDNDALATLSTIKGSAFEVVDESDQQVAPNSYKAANAQ